MSLQGDGQAALQIAKNPIFHECAEDINIDWRVIQNYTIQLTFCRYFYYKI